MIDTHFRMQTRALCFAENFQLNHIHKIFKDDASITISKYPQMLFIELKNPSLQMAIFEFGSVVFWGDIDHSIEQSKIWLNLFTKSPYPKAEMEYFNVVLGASTEVYGNTITLEKNDNILKIAISYALARAVKINQYENTVELTMQELESIPKMLSTTGRITIGRQEALKKSGQIFLVKSQINLHSDILDTPDYFWNRPESEKLYLATSKEMDLPIRIKNLNHRLDIMQNLYELLSDHINHSHGMVLEIIIIVLLCFEIILSVTSLYFGKFHV